MRYVSEAYETQLGQLAEHLVTPERFSKATETGPVAVAAYVEPIAEPIERTGWATE